MDEDGILKDCEVFRGCGAKGLVLFRYGLGKFPDLNEFFNK